MAAIDFPSFLRGPLVASYNRNESVAFRQNQPFSGVAYTESLTDDTPAIFNLEFAFEGGYKRAFIQWFNSPDFCNKGRALFNIDLPIESGIVTQEARFTADGIPQLTKDANDIFFYSAKVVVRKINEPDDVNPDAIIYLAGEYNGAIDWAMEQFDIGLNEYWPEE